MSSPIQQRAYGRLVRMIAAHELLHDRLSQELVNRRFLDCVDIPLGQRGRRD